MNPNFKRLGSFLIGLYAWVLTIFFGMVLLDILYYRLAPEAVSAFSEGSDFLLLVAFVTVIAAIVAVAFSIPSRAARALLIASLLVLSLEFLAPLFLSQWIHNAQEFSLGPWLRIIPTGGASILAFAGLVQYVQYTRY